MDKELIREIIASGSAVLTDLAKIAGQTGEHLYSVLVRQQIVEGISLLLQLAFSLSFLGLIMKFSLPIIIKIEKEVKESGQSSGLGWSLGFIEGVVVLIVLWLLSEIFGQAIQKMINPEFFVIKFIFEAIRPK